MVRPFDLPLMLASGRVVPLRWPGPTPQQIEPDDIAHGLARLNLEPHRTLVPYSAAQQALLTLEAVEAWAPELPDFPLRARALMANARLAYLGALSPAVWTALEDSGRSGLGEWRCQIEARFDFVIRQRFGLDQSLGAVQEVIERAAAIAYATAARDFMGAADPGAGPPHLLPAEPLKRRQKPMDYATAEAAWRAAFARHVLNRSETDHA